MGEELRHQDNKKHSAPAHLRTRLRHRRKIDYITVFLVIAILVVFGIDVYVVHRHDFKTSLPSSVTSQIKDFKLYFPSGGDAEGYTLTPNSTSYLSGVLIFSMKNPSGQTLAVTEEALPKGFDTSSLQSDSQFNTAYGQAFVTDAPNRTTGALITKDKTWVLMNATSPIGTQLMQNLLYSLTPQ